jgi:hypothetical protein
MEHNGRVVITGNCRTNGALQIAYNLPNRPEYMAAVNRLPHALEGLSAMWRGDDKGNVPDELRPEWMRRAGGAQVLGDKNQGSIFTTRNWFPLAEPQILGTTLANPSEGLSEVGAMLRPELKFGIEAATGMDIFRHRPIQPFSWEEVVSKPGTLPKALVGGSGTPLDGLFTMRPLREIRRAGEQPTAAGTAARVAFGGALQNIDADKAAAATDMDLNRQLGQLRVQYLRAQENKDEVEQASILRKIEALRAKRQKMGFKNSKGAAQSLQAAGVGQ